MLPSCGTLWVLYGFCICMGLWLWDFYEAVCHWGPGHHHSANKIELLPYVVALWALAFIHIYPQFMPHNNTSSRQCSSISTLHFTCPCHPLQTALWPQATPPPFTSAHIFPCFPRLFPPPNLLDFCNGSGTGCSSGCSRSSSAYTQFTK